MLLFGTIILVFCTGILLVLGLMAPPDRSSVRNRLDNMAQAERPATPKPTLVDAQFDASFARRILYPVLRYGAGISDRLVPGKSPEATRLALARAGNPMRMGVAEFDGVRIFSVILSGAAAMLALPYVGNTLPLKAGAFMLGLMCGFTLPDTLLQRKITERKALIRKSLPETIDLLIVSVEAGMGFDGAASKVVAKMRGPLAGEMERVLHEMRLGKSRMQCLKDMAARIDLPEVSAFVAAVYQADQLGVSIARVLHVQSETIRAARIQRIRETAATLPVKMLFPLVFFIFPAIFVVMLGPGFVRILKAF